MLFATHRQSGVTAVIVAILITMLFGFLALAWNIGHLLSVRGEMQNGADSAALGGASQLDGTPERLARVEAAANAFALAHVTDGRNPVVLTASSSAAPVVLGTWVRGQGFTPVAGRDAIAARQINAVRVNAGRQEANWLRYFVGAGENSSVDVMATAVSGGASQVDCGTAPLVIRSPCLTNDSGGLKCGDQYIMALSPAGDDTSGLTNLIPMSYSEALHDNSSSSAGSVCEAVRSDPPEGCVLEAGTTYLETTNGNEISRQCDDSTTEAMNEKICNWFKKWVSSAEEPEYVPIPVVEYLVDNRPGECQGQYGGTARIVGFAMFQITGVYCKGDAGQRTGPCVPFATKQCISGTYVCGIDPPGPPGPPGGGWFGTAPVPPALAE